jgi:hypothetical protein
VGIMRQALYSLLKQVLAETQMPVHLGVTVSSLDQDDSGVALM